MAQANLPNVLGPKKELHDLTGRTALITGGANGIGFQVARGFVEAGAAKVILVNRSEEQGNDSIDEIKKEYPKAEVEWHGCDLGSLKEVKRVFTGIRDKLDRLDLLVLSAGINTNFFDLDADGIERIFGVNYLGHFYAINILFPLIRKTSKMPNTPAPRIVFESSENHRMAPSNVHFGSIDEINDKETFGPTQLYARSKLAMILFAKYGLLEKVIKPNGDNIYAVSVHPGMVNTGMQQQWKDAYPGWFGKMISASMLAAGRSPEQGSFSALWAATSPEIEEKNMNGYYFADVGQEGKETSQASDQKLGQSLWDLSTHLVKEKVGGDALEDWNKS